MPSETPSMCATCWRCCRGSLRLTLGRPSGSTSPSRTSRPTTGLTCSCAAPRASTCATNGTPSSSAPNRAPRQSHPSPPAPSQLLPPSSLGYSPGRRRPSAQRTRRACARRRPPAPPRRTSAQPELPLPCCRVRRRPELLSPCCGRGGLPHHHAATLALPEPFPPYCRNAGICTVPGSRGGRKGAGGRIELTGN